MNGWEPTRQEARRMEHDERRWAEPVRPQDVMWARGKVR